MPKNQEEEKTNEEMENSSDSALEDLPSEIVKAIEELPDEEQKVKIKMALVALESTHYRGPIPDPKMLRAYNDIIDNGAERIICQFENQSNHRREMEKTIINSQTSESRRGQMFAFIIGITGLGLSFTSAIMGLTTFAITLASTTIVGLASAFIAGRKIQTKDLEEK